MSITNVAIYKPESSQYLAYKTKETTTTAIIITSMAKFIFESLLICFSSIISYIS